MNNPIILFFESVYYWLWHYAPEPKGRRFIYAPPIFASNGLFGLQLLNMYFIGLICAILRNKFLGDLFIYNLLLSIVGMSVLWYTIIMDERLYDNRHELIVKKFKNMNKKLKLKKKRIFLCYLLVTVITICLSPWVLSFYVF